jgi:hypothetical protein
LAPAAEREHLALEAGTLRATFDLANQGNIISLRSEGIEIVSNPQKALLFRIGLVRGSQVRYYTNQDFEQFEVEQTANSARFVFGRLAGRDLKVTVGIQRKGVALDFRINAQCGPQTVCSDLLFPCIGGFESLSGNPQDDRYVLPQLTGQLLLNPTQQLRQGRKQKLGSEGYPGTQGLQFHALYNQHGGIVMFTPDSDCMPKEFNLGRDNQGDSLTWYVEHYCDETPDSAFKPEYPVRMQACGPSWYDAADIYAAWGRKQWWMHKDITDDVFEEYIRPMAALPRGAATRRQLEKQFPRLGKYVYMCPTAEGYHAKLVRLVRKLTDYHHDFISMDIWPLGQPRTCHNSAHDHPPGLGKWYVDANIELIKRLRLTPVAGRSVHDSTLHNDISRFADSGKALVDIVLEPHELAVAEWK